MSDGATAVAVLIPCHNEAAAIGRVVGDFRAALPAATIYVYDNNSTDATAALARAAGAIVRHERLQGKGHVVRRMFADIEADVFVLVDGDDTYDAAAAPGMVARLVGGNLDMVVGARRAGAGAAWRPGHRFGNRLLAGLVRAVFGDGVGDMLSGFRAVSRRFAKSFPALSGGFETETELTIHALELRMAIAEVPTAYRERAAGSASKLRTFADGWRILRTILVLMKEERPFQVFGVCAGAALLLGVGLGVPVVLTFLHTGLVPRLPTAVLATGLVLLAALFFLVGLILDSITRGRRETKRLAYLAIPSVDPAGS